MRRRVRGGELAVAAALGLLSGVLLSRLPGRRPAPAAPHTDRFAVAVENPTAARVGLDVVRAGGNAADAAIAIAAALGVAQPSSSGIGGGGFALVWDAHSRTTTALDFRETAPNAVDAALLDGRGRTDPAVRGAQIGTPGEVAGLAELHRRFGRRSFADDLAPAVRLADEGYLASALLARNALAYHAELELDPNLRALFKPDGWAIGFGRRARNPALGATLRRIGAEGPRAFYEGAVAREIAEAARRAGGALAEDDLAAYRVAERAPLHVAWEGLDVVTMPPPSAGGLLLAETLTMHTKRDLAALGLGSGAYVHLLAETFRGATADRMRTIGDPAFAKADVAALVARERMRDRRARIALDRTHAAPKFPLEEHGTTHFVVVDGEGSVVSLTATINDAFGAYVHTATTGIVLNDELMDFTTSAAQAAFSAGDGPNRPRPRARPTSSMTPTIALRDGLPVLVVGGSGGLRIATGVTEAFLARTVFERPVLACVSMRRFHTPPDGPVVELEPDDRDALVDDLSRRGEQVRRLPNYSGITMVAIDRSASGAVQLEAASDPRKGGVAFVE